MSAAGEIRAASVSPAKAWWTVIVLLIAYIFSYIDRSIIALLVGPIKADLGLSDTQYGAVSGIAFAIFYAGVALPLAWLADRKSRRAIIIWGVTIWSLATAACGLAQNFWHLFAARMGVGAGEAVLQPAAFSLIADLMPKEKRGVAYGVFGSGTFIGGGLALIVGGAAVAWIDSLGTLPWPLTGWKTWQVVFLLVGLPGLLAALLMLTIHEPRHLPENRVQPAPPGAYAAFLKKNWVLLSMLFAGFAASGMVSTATQGWMPAFYMRQFGMTPLTTGALLGPLTLIVAPIGAVTVGFVLNYWTRKGKDSAPMQVAFLATIIQTPAVMIAPMMPTWESSMAVYSIGLFLSPWPYVCAAAGLQLITPPNLRAQVSALYAFVVTIIAIMSGPLLVGIFNDHLFRDEMAVGKSITLTCGIAGFIMAFLSVQLFGRFAAAVRVQEGRS